MSPSSANAFNARHTLDTPLGSRTVYRLDALREAGVGDPDRLPYSIKVLLEACLRHVDGHVVTEDDVRAIAAYDARNVGEVEVPFMPGRVVLQDFTGVPAVVDLAAMRSAMVWLGGDPQKVNPLVPCDLVIDHSVQVDAFGSAQALTINTKLDYERNTERYELLRWGQQAFNNFSVVPPATGIVHQVNLEYLAKVVWDSEGVLFPDSLVGTDSHTTMINGLGVVGWGVGGIEAEAVMLGQPIYMLLPEVVGFRLTGKLREGCTATDLVLTVTQMLRKHGVVGRFVEYWGDGLREMPLANRATIANMAPEYGATIGYFPIDEQTLAYLRQTGRDEKLIATVEQYARLQGLWRDDARRVAYSSELELDLGTVEPSLAGPKRPQDRIALPNVMAAWRQELAGFLQASARRGEDGGGAKKGSVASAVKSAVAAVAGRGGSTTSAAASGGAGGGATSGGGGNTSGGAALADDPGLAGVEVTCDGQTFTLRHGAVVIAAITSCTNTSNPEVMLAAGLLARKANARGLARKPWVKTSLAPGSQVVIDYFNKAGVMTDLEALGFYLVGFGCTTCIGNSGPLPEPISAAVNEHNLVVASVLSGNRNFEGRISPDVRANYLASPPLVVAYAIAGTVDINLTEEPLGVDTAGKPVYLRDIWPSQAEIHRAVAESVTRDSFIRRYADVFKGSQEWRAIGASAGALYDWDAHSTYIQEPPFFEDLAPTPGPIRPIRGARCLLKLGDSITTDHISPAGSIKKDSPAGRYLVEKGVPVSMFNSYGSRRGNDRVMTRGTFANIRVRNQLAPGTEGGWTVFFGAGTEARRYEGTEGGAGGGVGTEGLRDQGTEGGEAEGTEARRHGGTEGAGKVTEGRSDEATQSGHQTSDIRHQTLDGGTKGGTATESRSDEVTQSGHQTSDTRHHTSLAPGTVAPVFDAAMAYKAAQTPLVVLAGDDYGMGSSRDWAAKGTFLLGVKAVIAKSFERIHRSNLVGMGVLPLTFRGGQDAATLGLDGTEVYDIAVDDQVKPRQPIEVTATRADGTKVTFTTTCRIDTPVEVEYYRNGGILHAVLRRMAQD